jgi:hypothetical protein
LTSGGSPQTDRVSEISLIRRRADAPATFPGWRNCRWQGPKSAVNYINDVLGALSDRHLNDTPQTHLPGEHFMMHVLFGLLEPDEQGSPGRKDPVGVKGLPPSQLPVSIQDAELEFDCHRIAEYAHQYLTSSFFLFVQSGKVLGPVYSLRPFSGFHCPSSGRFPQRTTCSPN